MLIIAYSKVKMQIMLSDLHRVLRDIGIMFNIVDVCINAINIDESVKYLVLTISVNLLYRISTDKTVLIKSCCLDSFAA